MMKMRNHLQYKSKQWWRSSTLIAALVSFLITFGIHIAKTQAQENAWREVAANNINTYRKGDLTVVVTDANGKPVVGADVNVAMKRHAYSFGTAIDDTLLLSTTNPDGDKYRDNIRQLFNEATIENSLKWSQWENLESRNQAIKAIEWLRNYNLTVRGHALVWPNWQLSPPSLKTLYDNTREQAGKDRADQVLRDRIITHIREQVGDLKGQISDWDVVNEPIDNKDFQNILGQSVLVDCFKVAHEADPNAVLYINQNLYQDQNKALEYESEIQYLLDNGAPVSGIGIEGHIFDTAISIPEFLSTLDRFAKFKLPIKITEFDMLSSDRQLQADVTRDVMTAVFSNPATTGFIMWGFWDGKQWLNNAPIYFQDWSLKPSGKVYMDLVFNQWWTYVWGKTDANGEYKVRGFLGDYEVTASIDSKSKTLYTRLSREGNKLIISLAS